MKWKAIAPGLARYRDSCNVYAISHSGGTLFVNAGTGYWMDDVAKEFAAPYTVLCTHYFRDHAAGAAKATRLGMRVFAPAGELELFNDPEQHFRERPNYLIYDNIWDRFSPVESADAEPAFDYSTLNLDGLEVSVIPLPGVTPNHTGYAVKLESFVKPVIFSGEAIHSRGKMARVAPLQYDYNDLGGAVNAYWSAGELRDGHYAALLPSLGEPILEGVNAALAELQASLALLCQGRPSEQALLHVARNAELERVTDHVWIDPGSVATTTYVISKSGKAMAIDYGYGGGMGLRRGPVGEKPSQWPAHATRARRRPLLHGTEALRRLFGIEKVDVALVGHFHDDHVAGIPMLQRLHGTKCWAPSNFAHLLQSPDAHQFPCNWPEPIVVDRVLPLGAPFVWEEYVFRAEPMSGHTRFSAAILFEADGKKFAHTGDQYFFRDRTPGDENWAMARVHENQVYANGVSIDSYIESAKILDAWRPEIILTGHQTPMYTDQAFFERVTAWGETFALRHVGATAISPEDENFGVDGWGGWIWPYRLHLAEGVVGSVTVTVRNPFNSESIGTVRLFGPSQWIGSEAQVSLSPHAEGSCELTILPTGDHVRRQPIVAELSIGDRKFGQVAEALVTFGYQRF